MEINSTVKGLYNGKYEFEGVLLSYRHHTCIPGFQCEIQLTKPCKRPANAFYPTGETIAVHLPYDQKFEILSA